MFKSIEWNDGTLSVTFSNGGEYDYFDVPKEIYEQMMNAESKGKYFLTHVKEKFRYEKK